MDYCFPIEWDIESFRLRRQVCLSERHNLIEVGDVYILIGSSPVDGALDRDKGKFNLQSQQHCPQKLFWEWAGWRLDFPPQWVKSKVPIFKFHWSEKHWKMINQVKGVKQPSMGAALGSAHLPLRKVAKGFQLECSTNCSVDDFVQSLIISSLLHELHSIHDKCL